MNINELDTNNGSNTSAQEEINLNAPEYYINREISWLMFNERVLEESYDKNNPLLERLRFLLITENNLDEFSMVRIAGQKQMLANHIEDTGPDGLKPAQLLGTINEILKKYYKTVYEILNVQIIPELAEAGIHFKKMEELSEKGRVAVEKYFQEELFPILTPLAIDPGHPFPRLGNLSLNLAVIIKRPDNHHKGRPLTAVIQVPQIVPRLFLLPSSTRKNHNYILLEDIIIHFMGQLFSGYEIEEIYPFKITRDSDLIIEEDEADDLLATIQRELRKREKGAAVQLEVPVIVSNLLLETLKDALEIDDSEIFYCNGPIRLAGLKQLFQDSLLDERTYAPFTAITPVHYENPQAIFSMIRKNDIFVHLPFDSFSIVEDYVNVASSDPKVLAIKMTLYRTGGKSRILDSLIRAARNGKEVTALVELKARFDEETNIQWAKTLEDEGVHVVYGLIGLKTHAKICMIVRKEEDKIQRYVHLSTGNYNSITARIYTDMALFTADQTIADEIGYIFNVITGYSKLPPLKKMSTSPVGLKIEIIRRIRQEAENQKSGKPSYIFAKMNSLVDSDVIKELYDASRAGVKIDLLIRGICCLVPGIPGVSENITVRSIVGRLLEHSRIILFEDGGNKKLYFSSADWMPRNFMRRIETLFPIESEAIKNEVLNNIIPLYLADNQKARILLSNGTYKRVEVSEGSEPVNAQEIFIEKTRKELEKREKGKVDKKRD